MTMHAVCTVEGNVWRVISVVSGPIGFAQEQCVQGEHVVPIDAPIDGDIYFINPETGKANLRGITPCTPSRTEIPADGETALTLSRMRPNTVITVTGPVSATMTVEHGGSDTIRFHNPGTYTITAKAPFPAMPKEITINAT